MPAYEIGQQVAVLEALQPGRFDVAAHATVIGRDGVGYDIELTDAAGETETCRIFGGLLRPLRDDELTTPATAEAAPAEAPSAPAPAPAPVPGCPGPARAHCAYCGSHSTRPQDLLDNGDTYCCGAPVCRGDRGDCTADLDAHDKSFTA